VRKAHTIIVNCTLSIVNCATTVARINDHLQFFDSLNKSIILRVQVDCKEIKAK
jgi:hypothetical protein